MDQKRVDETWKEKIDLEKSSVLPSDGPANADKEPELPPVDFGLFLSSLAMQALMSLGEIENPGTNKKEKDLFQAKYIIDTIDMLKEKTAGNLSEEEKSMLESLLYELKIKFVAASK